VLRKVYGYSQREIAREMAISESTVEKHISTGIKRCAYWLMRKNGRGQAVCDQRCEINGSYSGASMTSNIHKLSSPEKRYDEASTWLAKLDRNISAEEERDIRIWMAADPKNKDVLFQLARLWDRMTALALLSELFPEPAKAPARWRSSLPIAASVLLAIAAGSWAYNAMLSKSPPLNTVASSILVYETTIGDRTTAILPDGSQITLNTNTRIEVKYTEQSRLISLDRGEIHVVVSHYPTRPLSVIAGHSIVQAVGTEFSIEITSDQKVELLVTDGRVLVGVYPEFTDDYSTEIPNLQDMSPLVLNAGEEVVIGDEIEQVREISPSNVEVKLSWRKGNLMFRGESLENAVAEIERYTTVQFVFLDEELKAIRVSGLFRAGDVDGLLSTLEENFNIVNRRDSDGTIHRTTQ